MELSEKILALFLLNGHIILSIILLIVFIGMILSRKNNNLDVILTMPWKRFIVILLIIEFLLISPWAIFGFYMSIFITDAPGSSLFYLNFSIVSVLVTLLIFIILFISCLIGSYKKYKLYKN